MPSVLGLLASGLLLAIPAATGGAAGWWVAPRMARAQAGRKFAWVLSLAAAAAITAALQQLLRVGVWDALCVGLAAGAGFAAGWLRPRPMALAVSAVSLCAALLVAELVVRLALPRTAVYYNNDPWAILLPDTSWDAPPPRSRFSLWTSQEACCALYPRFCKRPMNFATRTAQNVSMPGAPRAAVLHVGDSMTAGIRVAHERTFPSLLEALTPSVAHQNLGMSGAGPDYHLLALRRWLEEIPAARLVVVHLFAGNDVEGIHQQYPCCDNGPLLALEPGGVVDRCPEPRWQEGYGRSIGWFLTWSPPPSFVRQASAFSMLARSVVATTLDLQRRFAAESPRPASVEAREKGPSPAAPTDEQSWRNFERVMKELRDELGRRKLPLVVSVLPLRFSLDKPEPRATIGYAAQARMVEVCRRLGIETLDPWDAVQGTVDVSGTAALFLPDDLHFNEEGHRFYARWLSEKLAAHLAALGPGAGSESPP